MDDRQVPRIVHQIWLDSRPPDDAREWMLEVGQVARDSGWEYRFWDFWRLFRHIPDWARYEATAETVQHQANVARWLVLRQFGGLYLDADVRVYQLPTRLCGGWIQGTRYMRNPHGGYELGINCAALAAPPEHPHFYRLLHLLHENGGKWPRENGGNFYHRWALERERDLQIWPPHRWTNDPLRRDGGVWGVHLTKSMAWNSFRPAERWA